MADANEGEGTQASEKTDDKPMAFKDKLTIIGTIVALTISLVTFFRDNLFGQHILKASVVYFDSDSDPSKWKANILLVNSGKHTEVLFNANFIFAADLARGGGSILKEAVGPIVLEPGKATVLHLEATAPTNEVLQEDGLLRSAQSGVHVGVLFNALTPSDELRDDHDKIYRLTELKYSGTNRYGAKPRPGDNDGLIDLL